MKYTTITFMISGFDFTFIWSHYTKIGGAFNEFLVNYYIDEIKEKFPNVVMVEPKIYLTMGNAFSLTRLLFNIPDRMRDGGLKRLLKSRDANKLYNNFFVNKTNIINPIEVGI